MKRKATLAALATAMTVALTPTAQAQAPAGDSVVGSLDDWGPSTSTARRAAIRSVGARPARSGSTHRHGDNLGLEHHLSRRDGQERDRRLHRHRLHVPAHERVVEPRRGAVPGRGWGRTEFGVRTASRRDGPSKLKGTPRSPHRPIARHSLRTAAAHPSLSRWVPGQQGGQHRGDRQPAVARPRQPRGERPDAIAGRRVRFYGGPVRSTTARSSRSSAARARGSGARRAGRGCATSAAVAARATAGACASSTTAVTAPSLFRPTPTTPTAAAAARASTFTESTRKTAFDRALRPFRRIRSAAGARSTVNSAFASMLRA